MLYRRRRRANAPGVRSSRTCHHPPSIPPAAVLRLGPIPPHAAVQVPRCHAPTVVASMHSLLCSSSLNESHGRPKGLYARWSMAYLVFRSAWRKGPPGFAPSDAAQCLPYVRGREATQKNLPRADAQRVPPHQRRIRPTASGGRRVVVLPTTKADVISFVVFAPKVFDVDGTIFATTRRASDARGSSGRR